MIFATTPAFSLPPYCRSLKFEEWDELAAKAAERATWVDGSTDPGGYHGEVELTPVGVVPTVEI